MTLPLKYVEGSKRVFLDTGTRFPREMIWAVALVKSASAGTNGKLGLLDKARTEAIRRRAHEVMNGRHDDAIVVDVYQTGSGTGLNMNVNELVAELASRDLGRKVHPNDHVNLGQSSNDVGPAAVRMASARVVEEQVLPSIKEMVKQLVALSKKTSNVFKAGRTHLRDALPVTMGQEFGAYADAFSRDIRMVSLAVSPLLELPLGGTAVGTGLNADPRFGGLVTSEIARESKIGFTVARNKFRAMRLMTDVSMLSAALRSVSLDLYRLCQDIRLMYSGPSTGIGEIDIPSQGEVAGSSIMPGKTNPVTVESALLACAEVIGLDSANQVAASLGEFELAMGVPLIGYNVVLQAKLLSEALTKVAAQVVAQVTPNRARSKELAERSQALVTVISPKIGYDKAARLGKRVAQGVPIRSALKGLGFNQSEIDALLNLGDLVKPGIPSKKV